MINKAFGKHDKRFYSLKKKKKSSWENDPLPLKKNPKPTNKPKDNVSLLKVGEKTSQTYYIQTIRESQIWGQLEVSLAGVAEYSFFRVKSHELIWGRKIVMLYLKTTSDCCWGSAQKILFLLFCKHASSWRPMKRVTCKDGRQSHLLMSTRHWTAASNPNRRDPNNKHSHPTASQRGSNWARYKQTDSKSKKLKWFTCSGFHLSFPEFCAHSLSVHSVLLPMLPLPPAL